MRARHYLDWNATAPLRPEARAAMLAAMEVVGNPSSVHAEGRAAHAIVERAREDLAAALGTAPDGIIFTSGATEAAALALAGRGLHCGAVEHDCVRVWCETDLQCDHNGQVNVITTENTALQLANSETGIVQDLPAGLAVCDAVQGFGKLPLSFDWTGAQAMLLSAHKIGGPKGVGALVIRPDAPPFRDPAPRQKGGGQERGWRAGTENVIGIAGFAAAAQAAIRDLDRGLWDEVAARRDRLEDRLADAAPDSVIVGQDTRRLPNTTCIATPGWKGETQVMRMDLEGFAISAGSACASGKTRESPVLSAMGFDRATAQGAIRISIGPTTDEAALDAFVAAWARARKSFAARAV